MNRRQFFATLSAAAVAAPPARLGWKRPDAELTLPLDELEARYIAPAMLSLANDIDAEVLRMGDTLTFASVYAVNRPSAEALQLRQFIITDVVEAS